MARLAVEVPVRLGYPLQKRGFSRVRIVLRFPAFHCDIRGVWYSMGTRTAADSCRHCAGGNGRGGTGRLKAVLSYPARGICPFEV